MSAKSYCSSNSDVSEVGDNVYCIFLHIAEGVGFNTRDIIGDYRELNTPYVLLKASLNGVQFEVQGHCSPLETKFNSNCIWECKINDIKRMKSDNRPIKLECFSKCHRSGILVCDKLIGSLLLPIKCVPISSRLTRGPPTLKWHKLGTLSADWRYSKPEISLLLMIVKKSIIERGQMEIYLRRHNFAKTTSPKASETVFMLQSQKNIYIQLLEQDGVIQVGNNPDEDCETFRLTLTFRRVKNIESLLLNSNAQPHQGNTFVFSYDLLGQISNIDTWLNHGNGDCYVVNEKISVNFKSSLKSLRMYFEKVFFIPITIYSSGVVIAKEHFNLGRLLPSNDGDLNDINHPWTSSGELHFENVFTEREEGPSKLLLDYIVSLNCLPSNSNECETAPFKDAQEDTMEVGRILERNVGENCETAINKNTTEGKNVENEARTCCSIATNTDPSDVIDYEELSMKVVQELEQWKSQQMQTFLKQLNRKENHIKNNFQQNGLTMLARLESKIGLCDQLNSQLENMIKEFHKSTSKNHEHLELFDAMRREMEVNYEKKFMVIAEQMENLKVEVLEKDRSTDVDYGQITEVKAENACLKTKVNELKECIVVLQQQLAVSQSTNVPIRQLINLISDLGKQSERLNAAEKSSTYFQEQWSDVSHEINKIKLQLIELQDGKLGAKDLRSNQLSLFLNDIINDEQELLATERSELNSIRNIIMDSLEGQAEDGTV